MDVESHFCTSEGSKALNKFFLCNPMHTPFLILLPYLIFSLILNGDGSNLRKHEEHRAHGFGD